MQKNILRRMVDTLNLPMKRLISREFQRGMKCCKRICAKVLVDYYYYNTAGEGFNGLPLSLCFTNPYPGAGRGLSYNPVASDSYQLIVNTDLFSYTMSWGEAIAISPFNMDLITAIIIEIFTDINSSPDFVHSVPVSVPESYVGVLASVIVPALTIHPSNIELIRIKVLTASDVQATSWSIPNPWLEVVAAQHTYDFVAC